MTNLESFQQHANKSPQVYRTRLTRCRVNYPPYKEQRLWVYFQLASHPMLIKEHWLTGDSKRDLNNLFNEYMRI